jgi:hypothetical protein
MLVALFVALVGTAVLFALAALLHGLVGTAWDLSFCGLGAFLGTWLVNRRERTTFRENLGVATVIVFTTLAFISLGHAASQLVERHIAIDFEPLGKFIWATLVTSWWLIPLCALTLARLNRIGGPRAG